MVYTYFFSGSNSLSPQPSPAASPVPQRPAPQPHYVIDTIPRFLYGDKRLQELKKDGLIQDDGKVIIEKVTHSFPSFSSDAQRRIREFLDTRLESFTKTPNEIIAIIKDVAEIQEAYLSGKCVLSEITRIPFSPNNEKELRIGLKEKPEFLRGHPLTEITVIVKCDKKLPSIQSEILSNLQMECESLVVQDNSFSFTLGAVSIRVAAAGSPIHPLALIIDNKEPRFQGNDETKWQGLFDCFNGIINTQELIGDREFGLLRLLYQFTEGKRYLNAEAPKQIYSEFVKTSIKGIDLAARIEQFSTLIGGMTKLQVSALAFQCGIAVPMREGEEIAMWRVLSRLHPCSANDSPLEMILNLIGEEGVDPRFIRALVMLTSLVRCYTPEHQGNGINFTSFLNVIEPQICVEFSTTGKKSSISFNADFTRELLYLREMGSEIDPETLTSWCSKVLPFYESLLSPRAFDLRMPNPVAKTLGIQPKNFIEHTKDALWCLDQPNNLFKHLGFYLFTLFNSKNGRNNHHPKIYAEFTEILSFPQSLELQEAVKQTQILNCPYPLNLDNTRAAQRSAVCEGIKRKINKCIRDSNPEKKLEALDHWHELLNMEDSANLIIQAVGIPLYESLLTNHSFLDALPVIEELKKRNLLEFIAGIKAIHYAFDRLQRDKDGIFFALIHKKIIDFAFSFLNDPQIKIAIPDVYNKNLATSVILRTAQALDSMKRALLLDKYLTVNFFTPDTAGLEEEILACCLNLCSLNANFSVNIWLKASKQGFCKRTEKGAAFILKATELLLVNPKKADLALATIALNSLPNRGNSIENQIRQKDCWKELAIYEALMGEPLEKGAPLRLDAQINKTKTDKQKIDYLKNLENILIKTMRRKEPIESIFKVIKLGAIQKILGAFPHHALAFYSQLILVIEKNYSSKEHLVPITFKMIEVLTRTSGKSIGNEILKQSFDALCLVLKRQDKKNHVDLVNVVSLNHYQLIEGCSTVSKERTLRLFLELSPFIPDIRHSKKITKILLNCCEKTLAKDFIKANVFLIHHVIMKLDELKLISQDADKSKKVKILAILAEGNFSSGNIQQAIEDVRQLTQFESDQIYEESSTDSLLKLLKETYQQRMFEGVNTILCALFESGTNRIKTGIFTETLEHFLRKEQFTIVINLIEKYLLSLHGTEAPEIVLPTIDKCMQQLISVKTDPSTLTNLLIYFPQQDPNIIPEIAKKLIGSDDPSQLEKVWTLWKTNYKLTDSLEPEAKAEAWHSMIRLLAKNDSPHILEYISQWRTLFPAIEPSNKELVGLTFKLFFDASLRIMKLTKTKPSPECVDQLMALREHLATEFRNARKHLPLESEIIELCIGTKTDKHLTHAAHLLSSIITTQPKCLKYQKLALKLFAALHEVDIGDSHIAINTIAAQVVENNTNQLSLFKAGQNLASLKQPELHLNSIRLLMKGCAIFELPKNGDPLRVRSDQQKIVINSIELLTVSGHNPDIANRIAVCLKAKKLWANRSYGEERAKLLCAATERLLSFDSPSDPQPLQRLESSFIFFSKHFNMLANCSERVPHLCELALKTIFTHYEQTRNLEYFVGNGIDSFLNSVASLNNEQKLPLLLSLAKDIQNLLICSNIDSNHAHPLYELAAAILSDAAKFALAPQPRIDFLFHLSKFICWTPRKELDLQFTRFIKGTEIVRIAPFIRIARESTHLSGDIIVTLLDIGTQIIFEENYPYEKQLEAAELIGSVYSFAAKQEILPKEKIIDKFIEILAHLHREKSTRSEEFIKYFTRMSDSWHHIQSFGTVESNSLKELQIWLYFARFTGKAYDLIKSGMQFERTTERVQTALLFWKNLCFKNSNLSLLIHTCEGLRNLSTHLDPVFLIEFLQQVMQIVPENSPLTEENFPFYQHFLTKTLMESIKSLFQREYNPIALFDLTTSCTRMSIDLCLNNLKGPNPQIEIVREVAIILASYIASILKHVPPPENLAPPFLELMQGCDKIILELEKLQKDTLNLAVLYLNIFLESYNHALEMPEAQKARADYVKNLLNHLLVLSWSGGLPSTRNVHLKIQKFSKETEIFKGHEDLIKGLLRLRKKRQVSAPDPSQ